MMFNYEQQHRATMKRFTNKMRWLCTKFSYNILRSYDSLGKRNKNKLYTISSTEINLHDSNQIMSKFGRDHIANYYIPTAPRYKFISDLSYKLFLKS